MVEILKIKAGQFVLDATGKPKLVTKLSKNPKWKPLNAEKFTTSDLGELAHFRDYGTPKVQKILKRTFQEFYKVPKLPKLPGLDPHQREGIKWVLSRKRSYLAHAPGAGKTCQAILAAALSLGEGQNVFIVPPHLDRQWEREVLKFTEWLDLFPTIGLLPESDKKEFMDWNAQFLVIRDSMLHKDWVYTKLSSLKKKFIAVDEASRFKDPTAGRSIAFYGGINGNEKYRGLFQTARHVVFLDGSPMPNRPIELWAPCFALDPESIDYKGYDDFGYRYCGARPNEHGQWEYKYSSNESELKEKTRKTFMHVVPESDLDHPERRRSIVVMNEDVRSSDHREFERANLKRLKLGAAFWGTVSAEEMSTGDMARFRKQLGIRKIPWIASYVRDRYEQKNESILLFVWHREVVERLVDKLKAYPVDYIYGGMDQWERDHAVREFQTGETKILIMNILAAGRGLNLQRADRVIFGEFSWTDETNKQAEKRASRKGSIKSFVRCEYIVCPDSMDEIVLGSVFTKEKRVRRIVG